MATLAHLTGPWGIAFVVLVADLDWVHGMPVGGTQLVIFPEKDLVVDDAMLPGVIDQVAVTLSRGRPARRGRAGLRRGEYTTLRRIPLRITVRSHV